jgi:hypothetical protein
VEHATFVNFEMESFAKFKIYSVVEGRCQLLRLFSVGGRGMNGYGAERRCDAADVLERDRSPCHCVHRTLTDRGINQGFRGLRRATKMAKVAAGL